MHLIWLHVFAMLSNRLYKVEAINNGQTVTQPVHEKIIISDRNGA